MGDVGMAVSLGNRSPFSAVFFVSGIFLRSLRRARMRMSTSTAIEATRVFAGSAQSCWK